MPPEIGHISGGRIVHAMPTELPLSFLVYAAVFRISIIVAGTFSVVLGYRLLAKHINRQHNSGTIEASLGQAKFALHDLAPGSVLAVFGMTLIGVMLYQGMPELKQQANGNEIVLRSESRQGQVSDGLAALTNRAITLQQANNTTGAIEAYEEALDLMATPSNNLAGLYLQQNRPREALPLARLAADLRPTQASFLDTLSDALWSNGEHAEAVRASEKAAALDPQYRAKLVTLQQRLRP